MKFFSPSSTIALTICALQLAGAQNSAGKPELDATSLTPSTQALEQQIDSAIKAAGGDLERQNVNWVFAFSTGHFKTDPIAAQAARTLASQLVGDEVVTGDHVSARAWEGEVWNHKGSQPSSLQVGQDAKADKARTADLWPTTPAVGSVGGHDTERAAVQLTGEFARNADTVLVLITNTAASVGAPGAKLMGSNAPEYQSMLGQWTRVGGTGNGATTTVPYVIKSPTGNLSSQLETVVFVPKSFTAADIGKTARSALLKQQSAVKAAPSRGGAGGAIIVVVLLALAGLGALAYFLLRGGKGGGGGRSTVRVEGQTFRLADQPNNKVFCVLAGPGFKAEDGVPVAHVQGTPNDRFAELTRVGNDVRVRGLSEDFELKEINGAVVTGPTTLKLRPEVPEYTLEFAGEVRGASGVPRAITKNVTLTLTQGDA